MGILMLFIFVLGCCIGSFLNVCIYRLPLDLSIVRPRSFCPGCQKPIPAYDNVPLVSFLLLRGKCRACGTRISLRYPLVELLTGVMALALFYKFGPSVPFVASFVLGAALIVVTFIDLDHRIIPSEISLPGMAAGFLLALLGTFVSVKESLIGLVAGGGSLFLVAQAYELLKKREGMGRGDVYLLAMIGSWLGWKAIPFTLFFSSLSGTLVGMGWMAARKEGLQLAIPFGPFLAGSALAYLFFGPELIEWYLNWGRI